MVLLAEAMKTKTLTTGTSLKTNAGFTLIELLVVVAIVAILAGFVTLSVKLAKPSAVNVLKAKIQQHITLVKNHVQLYNQPIRLQINQDNMQAFSFQPEPSKNTEDKEGVPLERSLEKSLWQPNSELQPLAFKPVEVSISRANAGKGSVSIDRIEILPNGFITDAIITLSQGDESISLKTIANEKK